MSTIVCFRTPERKAIGVAEYGVYDVVDGQQRLTTLVLLLKAIQKALREGSEEKRDLGSILVKSDGNLLLLQTNNPNQRQFNDYLRSGSVPGAGDVETHANLNLRRAISECESFVARWMKG